MAKVLISSLGTGEKKEGVYQKAIYKINNKTYETSFIADALVEHLDIEKLFLIGTKKSIWDEAYEKFNGTDENQQLKLMEKKDSDIGVTIDDLKSLQSLELSIKPYIIDYGINEIELWSNFKEFLKIANELEDGDELYLDITHSFRSLSLMSFVMTQFASSISEKNFKIAGVYYGMFEFRFENKGVTQIVDIKIFLEIQEWIKAIDAIKNYSDFNPLVNLLGQSDLEESIYNTFINLNNTIHLASMSAMKQFIDTAHKKLNQIENSSNPIMVLLGPEIQNIVNDLSFEKMSDFQYALAKWLHKNQNHALAYIALYEAIITKSCESHGYDIKDHTLREMAKTSIGNDKYGKYFYTKYDDSISRIRNSIVHQSNDRTQIVKQDIDKLTTFLQHFEPYFKS